MLKFIIKLKICLFYIELNININKLNMNYRKFYINIYYYLIIKDINSIEI